MNKKLLKDNKVINKTNKLKQKRHFPLNLNIFDQTKLQLCKFYIKGKCKNGHSCQFLHSTTPMTKKKLCWYYIAGKCSKNNECQYSHDISQFPCRYLNTVGFCRNLKSCRFSHELITTDEQRETFVRENKDYLLLPHEKGGPSEMNIDHMWWKPILNKILQEEEKLTNQNSLLKDLYIESKSAVPKGICNNLPDMKEEHFKVNSAEFLFKSTFSEPNLEHNQLKNTEIMVNTDLNRKGYKIKSLYSNLYRTSEELLTTQSY